MTGAMARELGAAMAEREREPCRCDRRITPEDCHACVAWDLAHEEKERVVWQVKGKRRACRQLVA
jgi:hypothetical protein